MDLTGLQDFPLSEVNITDNYCENAFEKEVLYLTAFDTDKLLAGFRETAGVDMRGATRYECWENMLIGGHTLGHYMTACAHAYECGNSTAEQREALGNILETLVLGLKECQDALGNGFIFGAIIPDPGNIYLQFDNVEHNLTNIITQAWVPWYTMHKIFEGLLAVAGMKDEKMQKTAALSLEIASALADWTYRRAMGWDEETHRIVLGIEYGGMNDCLYDLYLMTGKKEHLDAAHAFDQDELFERIANAKVGDNVLNNYHANTTIPKFVGAIKRYMVVGEERYRRYADRFWDMVVENHSYITGGNSEWEHFGADGVLDAERTNCTCETCNSYNMLKLTKYLYMISGNMKYADWYENTYINSVLSSQNPETGMTTYFQPMSSGYFKVYGERFNKFWCCIGSGMENFTKLGESYYYHKDENLIVDQYFSSILTWKEKNITLTQVSSIPESDCVNFTLEGELKGNLLLRIPEWIASDMKIQVNGADYAYTIVNAGGVQRGYAVLDGKAVSNARIDVVIPMKITAHNLPDGRNTYAFKYGPVVLCALLGTKDMELSSTGVNVTIPANRLFGREYLAGGSERIRVESGTVEEFIGNIQDKMVRDTTADILTFRLTGTDANLTYTIHYKQYQQRYGLYFTFCDSMTDTSQVDQESIPYRLENDKLDTVQPGYGQYENDALHNMTEYGTGSVGTTSGQTNRRANAGGRFSYNMIVDTNRTDLLLQLSEADDGKTLVIRAGGAVIFDAVLNSADIPDAWKQTGTGELYYMLVPIPAKLLAHPQHTYVNHKEQPVLEFTFEGRDGAESAALCEFLYTLK